MANTFKDKMKANKKKSVKSRKDRLKEHFDKKLWSPNMLKIAVKKGELTPVEFKEITGVTYD